jgi:DNA-binding CsgD family transcriptional regulator
MPDLKVLAAELEAHHLNALSAEELHTLARLAVGDSYQQIARAQNISVDCARQRASRATRKLDCRSVVHAVAVAVRRGLITGAEA